MDVDFERAAEIATLNDKCRSTRIRVVLTAGVNDTLSDIMGLMQAVRDFDLFTEDNDPYGEHDFGPLEWHGSKVFWKIDYYDPELKYGCDPLDVGCKRVLTVMLASEY